MSHLLQRAQNMMQNNKKHCKVGNEGNNKKLYWGSEQDVAMKHLQPEQDDLMMIQISNIKQKIQDVYMIMEQKLFAVHQWLDIVQLSYSPSSLCEDPYD